MISFDTFWYKKSNLAWMLYPFALLYRWISISRRFWLTRFCQRQFDIPVIVVGNISVGGVGKTPLVIALVDAFKARGVRVGIVSRGYGARISTFPHEVSSQDDARMVGDEPLLMARRTQCPVVIAPKRIDAIHYLRRHHAVQVIVSDDGLQHYAMGRAIEIAVVDGMRGMGNGLCLPAGPLREPVKRLKEVDFVVVNGHHQPSGGYQMTLVPSACIQITTNQPIAMTVLSKPVAAVAGIGNPNRYFETLKQNGVTFNAYPFPDHHVFQKTDLHLKEATILMTEKDAVKCRSFATDSMYYLQVSASLTDEFWQTFWSHKQLQGLI